MVTTALETGFALDELFFELVGGRVSSKKDDLVALTETLGASGTDYAIISGVAMQLRQKHPRTTLDIDVAVQSWETIPSAALQAAGFVHEQRFAHSDNWRGPGGTPVQFSAEPAFHAALARAEVLADSGLTLRTLRPSDLLEVARRDRFGAPAFEEAL